MVVMVVVLLVLYRVYPCLPVYPEVYLLTSVSEYAQSLVLDPRCARLDHITVASEQNKAC